MREWRKPPAIVVAAGAFLAVFAVGASARATDCGAALLSTCIDDDNLWPHAGSAHFISVGGSDTIEADQVGFGIAATYLSRPIVIKNPSPGPPGSVDNVIDNQVTTTFLWSYGITRRLELDLILPVTLGQNGTGTTPITGASPQSLTSTASRDIRFGFAYGLVKRDAVDPYAPDPATRARADGIGVALRFEVSAPTGDTGQFATNGTGVYLPGISSDYRYGRFFAGAEAGLRLRATQEFAGARIGNQAYVALGAAFDVLDRELFTLGAEAFALPTFAEQHSTTASQLALESVPDGRYITPAEWMVSARSAPLFGGALQIQLAGGGPIPFSDPTLTNPRFRFTLSLRYARQGRDSDGDGVTDEDDKCPFVRGVPNNPAGKGCPASATTERLDLTGLPTEPVWSPSPSPSPMPTPIPPPTSATPPSPTPAPTPTPAPIPTPAPLVTWPATPHDSSAQPR
jgi:OmpA-OmpF porin, OOP family